MPIVINEFEIVPAPAPPQEARLTPRAEDAEEPVSPEPWEILRVEQVFRARMDRLRAD
jgi:hypothetical protein